MKKCVKCNREVRMHERDTCSAGRWDICPNYRKLRNGETVYMGEQLIMTLPGGIVGTRRIEIGVISRPTFDQSGFPL